MLRRELLDGAWNRICREVSAETRGPSFAMRLHRFVTPRGFQRSRCGFTSYARDAPLANVRGATRAHPLNVERLPLVLGGVSRLDGWPVSDDREPLRTAGSRFSHCARRFSSRRSRWPRSVTIESAMSVHAVYGPSPSQLLIDAEAAAYEPKAHSAGVRTGRGGW